MLVMRTNIFEFRGRGSGAGKHDDSCRIVECSEGSVLAIIYSCHGVEFIQGYCRRAMIDPWGLYCDQPFRRASNMALSRSWAERTKKGLFLFRPTRLEIFREQDWMRLSR
jgi:hypothetical protein